MPDFSCLLTRSLLVGKVQIHPAMGFFKALLEELAMDKTNRPPAYELTNISKSFPGVKALDHVSLTLHQGEVQALLGENGAGKSTLIKIVSGVIQPDEGVMRLNSQEIRFRNPRDAFIAGINAVHQERNLVPTFTVAENILMEQIADQALGFVDMKKINLAAEEFIEMIGLKVSPQSPVNTLSASKRQMVEIARALSSHARILLLDEPTASISLKEAATLMDTIRRLQAQGVSFIFVSHKLEDIFDIADSVTVLRDGKNAGEPSQSMEKLTRGDLVTLMVGRSEVMKSFPVRDLLTQPAVLQATNLSGHHSQIPNSFTLHAGEILGWYGLVGAGRTELARVLVGGDRAISGEIRVKDVPAKINSISQALYQWRIGYITENRQEEGLFLIHSITRNIASTAWGRLRTRLGFLNIKGEEKLAEDYRNRLEIRTPSLSQLITNLSGGNRQKVSIAKGLAAKPEILVVDEPTIGIDIKTKAEIHDLIWDLAQRGMSIILISSDMPELIKLADRILVFREGQICGELPSSKQYDNMSKKIIELIVGQERSVPVSEAMA